MNQLKETKVVIGIVRFSYCHVWAPQESFADDKPKYSVSLIIPKSNKEQISRIKSAIENALANGIATGKFAGKNPKIENIIGEVLRDGDAREDGDGAYAGAYYIAAKSVTRPGVVNKALQPITDQDEFYSGCYGYASVNFYAYNMNGNRGIACGLNNLMKSKDGDYLGGRATAENDFAGLEPETDDLLL